MQGQASGMHHEADVAASKLGLEGFGQLFPQQRPCPIPVR
jgi:hypothetical protein